MPLKIDVLRAKTREQFKIVFGYEYIINNIQNLYKDNYNDKNTDGYYECPNESSAEDENNLLIMFLCDDINKTADLTIEAIRNLKEEYTEDIYIYFVVSFLDTYNDVKLCYTKLFSDDSKTYFIKDNDPILSVFRRM